MGGAIGELHDVLATSRRPYLLEEWRNHLTAQKLDNLE